MPNLYNQDLIEILYPAFKIVYTENLWYAESLDPDLDENIILISGDFEDEKHSFEESELELFDGYKLNQDEFEKLQKIVDN